MENKEEEWKPLTGYDCPYAVSNKGNIKRLKHITSDIIGRNQHFKEKLLTPVLHNSGYLVVTLRKNKHKCTVRCHRLIAMLFVENPFNNPIVDHIDGNKTNNNANNLRWVTNSENILNPNTYSDFKNKCLITQQQYVKPVFKLDNNFKVIAKYDSVEIAAKEHNCTPPLIRKCCKNKHYTAKGFHWSYTSINLKLI